MIELTQVEAFGIGLGLVELIFVISWLSCVIPEWIRNYRIEHDKYFK